MTDVLSDRAARHRRCLGQVVLGLAFAFAMVMGCSPEPTRMPPGAEPDRFLLDQAKAAMTEEKWLTARQNFQQLLDSYPQSVHRMDAKLGLADAYFEEDSAGSYVLAISEYREFLTFYPSSPRAGYAQYRIGMCAFQQMRRAERDQTQTRLAITEFELFVERYPNSEHMPEVAQRLQEAKDRLSEADYLVGYFYFRQRWLPGAVIRLKAVLQDHPQYSRRDAVYFYLAESLRLGELGAEALPYYERLIEEFEQSEYLEQAKLRAAELKAAQANLAK